MTDGKTIASEPDPAGAPQGASYAKAGRPRAEPPPPWVRSPLDEDEDPGEALPMSRALEWVAENQIAAMLGAFAAGVFIGVLMRR